MIIFTFNVEKKTFVDVRVDNEIHQPTMIKVDDTSNEGLTKACQEWLDAFGLTDKEYQILVRLH